jgi:hypothetical protein
MTAQLKVLNMVIDFSELRISEMIRKVPKGEACVFEPTLPDSDEELYFRVHQNWDYYPGRLEWRNKPTGQASPWLGDRTSPRMPVTTLSTPDVRFKGPSQDVVDFHGTGTHAYLISEPLFQLIDGADPGSLEHVECRVRARDAELPFRLVMPCRVLEAIDAKRTKIVIKDEDYAGTYFRTVRFPEGLVFNNQSLRAVENFSDLDAPGWYWSKDLIALAEAHGIRGLYAHSVASSPGREIARL